MKCGDCRYWLHPDADAPGVCRRYPPQLLIVPGPPRPIVGGSQGAAMVASFPQTPADSFCGEFSAPEIVE